MTTIADFTKQRHQCKCGGSVDFKGDVMLCDRCGYGASLPIDLGDRELIEGVAELTFRRPVKESA